ncbi:uncharacterized protein LOC119406826 [Rhipicephalus sanguineus]|uniref:uncharacterized protein LOC119406826 n=1 Tax=Rhipicephalus sanguineus TaxID=34632 RepID=UPI001894E74B|nr:uncharacterized protein LOC119406826 [Rhipicephalus sanguineus]
MATNDATQTERTHEAPQYPAVSAVALKLPCFWPADPALWFAQVEAQFTTRRIVSQETKFHHVIAALTPTEAAEVRDIILAPPTEQPYDALKRELIRRTTLSEQKRLQQLLTAQDLGDRKPSQLLRGMRQLHGEKASKMDDSLLRQLFLQRLPANVCMVLAAAGDLPLDDLAALADRVLEVATPAISAFEGVKASEVSPVTSTGNCSAELQSLKQEVQRIAQSLEALKIQVERRSRSTSRNRASSRSSDTGRICWYHHRFGDNATKCVSPCAHQGNVPATH